jgi:O-antigen/teichoic acid export membrane protein
VVDAGVSALATFAAGLYATRHLDPTTLGAYAMAYSIFVLASWIPAASVCMPAEILATTLNQGERLSVLRDSLWRCLLVAAIAGLITSAWVLVRPAGVEDDAIVALAVTCAGASVVSPVQDHLRRMFHVAGASVAAVVVALCQLASVLVALGTLTGLGLESSAVPFGSLLVANLVSLVVGVLLVGPKLRVAPTTRLTWRDVRRSGGPLLGAGLIPSATTFLVANLVSLFAGAAALGHVEAARILSQPVAVLGTGLNAVLGPRVTRAAHRRDRGVASHLLRRYHGLLIAAGAVYLLGVSVPREVNVLASFVPTAYAVPGLLAVSIVAYTAAGLALASRSEQLGAAREWFVARVEVEGNAARLLVGATAAWIGPFAAPAGLIVLALIRLVRYGTGIADHYLSEERAPSDVRAEVRTDA